MVVWGESAVSESQMGDTIFPLGVGKEGDGLWVVFSWKMDPQEAGFHSPKQHLLLL